MAITVSRVPEAFSRNPARIQSGEENMPIQVFGGMQQAGGFKQAMKEHRQHWQKQGDELLQVAEGLDHNEPRAPYQHQGFPKMLYQPIRGEKGEKVVMSAQEMAVAIEDGWREEPYEFPSVVVLDPQTEKKILLDKLQQSEAERIQAAELMKEMAARLERLEKSKGKEK